MAVGFSNFEAGLAMTRYLIGKGHRRLAYHGGTQTDNDRTQARERGFRQALADACLPIDETWVRSAPMELTSGAALAREIKAALKSASCPQAIFIASDIIAAGFVLEASRIRLRVPQDVAIAGFDRWPRRSCCRSCARSASSSLSGTSASRSFPVRVPDPLAGL
jgi:LacI family transcriptional regulator, gluconate utilization system Gnt-I transcriptional repressor